MVWTFRANGSRPPTLAQLGPLAPDIEDIVRQARESVVQAPGDGERWGRFGMVCEANGLIGAARDAYVIAARLQGAEARWWYHLAAVDSRLGRTDDAVRDVRHAIDLNPAYAPAFWRLGLWLLDQNTSKRRSARSIARRRLIRPIERDGSAWRGCICSAARTRAPRDCSNGWLAPTRPTRTRCNCSARRTAGSDVSARRRPPYRWVRRVRRSGATPGPTRCRRSAAATPPC